MRLDWVLNPLVPFAMIGIAMVACLALFFTFKAELASLCRRTDHTGVELAGQVKEVVEALGELQGRFAAIEERPPVSLGPSLNLTKRSQALRMYHRGEVVATIAGALQAPRAEIELLLKLQKSIQHRNAGGRPGQDEFQSTAV